MRLRVALAGAAMLTVALAVTPSVASAHGLVGKQDLPIPRLVFVWGASAVLVISFIALATLWPRAVMQEPEPGQRVLRLPGRLEAVAGAVGIAAFAAVAYSGFAGTQTATHNLAPDVIYVIFWVGVPVASLFFGDVFRAINPWRAMARAIGWAARRVLRGDVPEPLAYPPWLGRWPAVLGILGFAWCELAYSNRDDPATLAILAVSYAALQILGMGLYGIEPWSRYGDAFGVYFNLFSRLSPLRWRGTTLVRRRPVAAASQLEIVPGTVALLCAMIGTTSFDGLSQGPTWTSLATHLQDGFVGLGLSLEHALEAAFTVGLVGMVLVIAAVFRLGIIGMHSVGPGLETGELSQRFVHSLIPIALAYVVAHYCSLLAYQGQALGYLVSDPLGDGSNIFGTASSGIDYSIISATGIWYVQVAALVLGHAAGLTLAHDRALALYPRPGDATRSQYWMLAVMVGFTSLGLWLLSATA